MTLLLFKLMLTPLLIGLASLVGRRWGPAVGGWLVGLPLTSGPVSLFLALDHGPRFAAAAASGSLIGAAAEAGFCLAYAAAGDHRWPLALTAGTAGFILASIVLQPALALPTLGVLAVAIATLLVALRLQPAPSSDRARIVPPPWDLPARMLIGAALVVGLTTVAPALGPQLSGLAAAFPVFATVLTVFAHVHQGRAGALQVLRGLIVGLFAFTAFFAVIGTAIVPFGIGTAFALAIASALVVQAISLHLMRRLGRGKAATDLSLEEPQPTMWG